MVMVRQPAHTPFLSWRIPLRSVGNFERIDEPVGYRSIWRQIVQQGCGSRVAIEQVRVILQQSHERLPGIRRDLVALSSLITCAMQQITLNFPLRRKSQNQRIASVQQGERRE